LTENATEVPSAIQQIGMLNLRINDMMTQLNTVIKMMMDENSALKKENAELKTKQEKTSKS
jgi:regulator of replication initiation timing